MLNKAFPENPNTTIIRNQYYSSGLTEAQIYKHYQKHKDQIIKEINKRPIALYIYTEENIYVVKKWYRNQRFTLDYKNYDKIITGRSVSLGVEQTLSTTYLVIDIDGGSNITDIEFKDVIEHILRSPILKMDIVRGHRIILTSNSYHIHLLLNKSINIKVGRNLLQRQLESYMGNMCLVNKRNPKSNEINLDLSPNSIGGTTHVVPFSLNRNGLIAYDITYNWKSFSRRNAVVK